MTIQVIRDRLETILKQEHVVFEEKALASIAREGHGSMRDALTLLDHVIAIGNGKVTMDALSKIVSHVTSTPFINLLAALVDHNPKAVIALLDQLERTGIDMKDVAEKTTAMARHAGVARDVGIEQVDFRSLGFDDEEARSLHRIGTTAKPLDLNRLFRTLFKSIADLDGSALDRFVFENYCLEWCLDPGLQWLSSGAPTTQTAINNNHIPSATPRPAAPSAVVSKGLSSMLNELHGQEQAPVKSVEKVSEKLPEKSLERPATVPASFTTALPQMTSAQPTVASAAELAPPTTARQGATNAGFPETWRQLVDAWKQQKPLQARKLEEAHPIKYSLERIELVIPLDSYASASLLRPDEQKKLKDAFAELFGFKGQLLVTPKTGATVIPENTQISPAEPLPETLASIKGREDDERRKKIITTAENHPLTRDAMRMFDATIKEVIIHDT